MPKFPILLCVYIAFASCSGNTGKRGNNGIVIDVQPFDGMPEATTAYIVQKLHAMYPDVRVNEKILPPGNAYNNTRKRYRADSLINFLNSRTPTGHVTIGLTNKDISTTKNAIADWGVMGLGFCPGKACIASTFRLDKGGELLQLYKVSIHELGHTEGLPHCPVKNCFMRDAEGGNPINEENEFCEKCKHALEKKGWKF